MELEVLFCKLRGDVLGASNWVTGFRVFINALRNLKRRGNVCLLTTVQVSRTRG